MKFLSSFTLLTFVAVALGYGLISVTGQEALVAALVEDPVGSVGVEDLAYAAPVGGAGVEDEESAGVQSLLNPVGGAGVQPFPKVPKRKTARKKKESLRGLFRKVEPKEVAP